MMRQRTLLIALALLVIAAAVLGQRALDQFERKNPVSGGSPAPAPGSCRRIVSLAPSLTETLFFLGLGDRVVGVTRFCRYPPGAQRKTRVGGYYDQNYEAILSLKPDLVIMLPEHEEQKRHLVRLGLPVLLLDNRDLQGILHSIVSIGKACGQEETASAAAADLRERIERVRHKTNRLPRTRVIVSIGRNMGSHGLRNVYLSGRQGFYNEMIELAGGLNAYEGPAAFPVFSEEGIVRLNPDVVIDLVPDLEERGWDRAALEKDWATIFPISAARSSRVHILGQDYVVVPGPRFILLLEEMARIIHPEAAWEQP